MNTDQLGGLGASEAAPRNIPAANAIAGTLFCRFYTFKPNSIRMASADLFVLGCGLHANGNKAAGLKACETALGLLPASAELKANVLTLIPGNEKLFSGSATCHVELEGVN